jgi:hypothetical protein
MAGEVMAPEKLVARKGRLRQRYDNEYRLVAGCVPYRVDKDGRLEVLMVSTPSRDDLVFPKVTPTQHNITIYLIIDREDDQESLVVPCSY